MLSKIAILIIRIIAVAFECRYLPFQKRCGIRNQSSGCYGSALAQGRRQGRAPEDDSEQVVLECEETA